MVMGKKSFIYHTVKPERTTIEVSIRNGEPYLVQMQCYRNHTPTDKTRAMVKQWLADW